MFGSLITFYKRLNLSIMSLTELKFTYCNEITFFYFEKLFFIPTTFFLVSPPIALSHNFLILLPILMAER